MSIFRKSLTGIAFMSIIAYTSFAQAYTWTFTNLLKEDVAVDFCLIAKIGCTAFGGWHPDKPQLAEPSTFGNTTRYDNAHELKGPQIIKAGHTSEYNFKWENIGMCLDIPTIKVGVASEGYSVYKRPLLRAPDQYMHQLVGEINKTGKGISEASSSLSKSEMKGANIAGQAGEALGSLLSAFSSLIEVSACKPGSFYIFKNDKGEVVIGTSDFGG